MSDDYYSILGVTKTCSQDEIKKAYKKLALKWHPDKNKSSDAIDMFKKIGEAYATLSEPSKREIYDKYGREGLDQNGIHFDPNNIFDMFQHVFGGQHPFPGFFENMFQSEHINQSRNIELMEKIQLIDVFNGKKIKRDIIRETICSGCNGMGSDNGLEYICTVCKGKKIVQQQHRMGNLITINTIACITCKGTGTNYGTHKCKLCNGSKMINESYQINYDLSPGYADGDIIIIPECGHANPSTKTRRDVVIKIVIEQDKRFHRNVTINGKFKIGDSNLLTQLDISLAESLCGFTKTFTHITGKQLTFKIDHIIHKGSLHIINGEGMPHKPQKIPHNEIDNHKCGDLYIIFNVIYPESLHSDQKHEIWKSLTRQQLYEQNIPVTVKINKVFE